MIYLWIRKSDKFRMAAAGLNFSIKVPARVDLIFKTQSGSDRKKMFDWLKPKQATQAQAAQTKQNQANRKYF